MYHNPDNYDMALGAIKKLSGLQQIHLVSLVQKLGTIRWQRIGQSKRKVLNNLRDIQQAVEDVTPLRTKLIERLNFYPRIAGNSDLIQHLTDQLLEFLDTTGFVPAVTRAKEVYIDAMQKLGDDTSAKAVWILQQIRRPKKKQPKDIVFRTIFIKDIDLNEMSLEEVITMATEKTAEILPNLEVEALKGGLCQLCEQGGHTAIGCTAPIVTKLVYVESRTLCHRCLSSAHRTLECKSTMDCGTCGGPHHSSICIPKQRLGRSNAENTTPCPYCSEDHRATQCPLPSDSKILLLKIQKRCRRCLAKDHQHHLCKKYTPCKICNHDHHYTNCTMIEDAVEDRAWKLPPEEQHAFLEKQAQRRLMHLQLTATALRKITKPWTSSPCRYCSSTQHNAENCPEDILDKQIAIVSKKLCGTCLSSQHTMDQCHQQFVCKKCGDNHLHMHCDEPEHQETIIQEDMDINKSMENLITQLQSFHITKDQGSKELKSTTDHLEKKKTTTDSSSVYSQFSTTDSDLSDVESQDSKGADLQRGNMLELQKATIDSQEEVSTSKASRQEEDQVNDTESRTPNHTVTSGIFQEAVISQNEDTCQSSSSLTATHTEEDCQTSSAETEENEKGITVVERLYYLIAFQSSNRKFCQSYIYYKDVNDGQERVNIISQTRHAPIHVNGLATPIGPSYAAQEAITFLHATKGRWNIQEVILLHSQEDILSNQSVQSSVISQAQPLGTRIWFKQIQDIPSPDQSDEEIDQFIFNCWKDFQTERLQSSVTKDLTAQAGPGNGPLEEKLSLCEQLKCTQTNSSDSEYANINMWKSSLFSSRKRDSNRPPSVAATREVSTTLATGYSDSDQLP